MPQARAYTSRPAAAWDALNGGEVESTCMAPAAWQIIVSSTGQAACRRFRSVI
jgi:hypothetical protein